MKKKAEYKSALRSKAMLREAFITLSAHTDVSRITVSELVETAGLNRGTFYAHYCDVYDFIDQMEDRLIVNLKELQNIDSDPSPRSFILAVASYLEQNYSLCRCLICSDRGQQFINKLERLIIEKIMSDQVLARSVKNKDRLRISAVYIAAGGVAVLKEWISGMVNMPLDQVVSTMEQLMQKRDDLIQLG